MEEAIVDPKEGWVEELYQAKQKAKEENTAASYLRVAIARRKLRQWEHCKLAASTGWKLLSTEKGLEKKTKKKIKEGLKELHECAKMELSKKDSVNRTDFLNDQLSPCRNGEIHPDAMQWEQPGTLFHPIHVATVTGNVDVLEQLIALGAAVDMPLPNDETETPIAKALSQTTALLLACAALAQSPLSKKIELKQKNKALLTGMEECAIQLVMLGADFTKKIYLVIPAFHGKSAKDLAEISGRQNLINAMKQMNTKADKIANAHCRCGSRLPWCQCHAGNTQGQSAFYLEKDERILFRYSPLAICPCRLSKKTHFFCCWKESSIPLYKDDNTGKLRQSDNAKVQLNPKSPLAQALDKNIQWVNEAMNGKLLDPEHKPFYAEKFKAFAIQSTRILGERGMQLRAEIDGPKSNICDWDYQVYAGCMERSKTGFPWRENHWHLSKTEVLWRADEWNIALEQHCNDEGFAGAERAAVIKKHTANPCAPCAHPSCDVRENYVKQFNRCSRCKRVAYCSKDCQTSHWREHKPHCVPT